MWSVWLYRKPYDKRRQILQTGTIYQATSRHNINISIMIIPYEPIYTVNTFESNYNTDNILMASNSIAFRSTLLKWNSSIFPHFSILFFYKYFVVNLQTLKSLFIPLMRRKHTNLHSIRIWCKWNQRMNEFTIIKHW